MDANEFQYSIWKINYYQIIALSNCIKYKTTALYCINMCG